jgi:iron complex transport system permease protein
MTVQQTHGRRQRVLFAGLALMLVVSFVMSIGRGAVSISPVEVAGILLDHAGLESPVAFDARKDAVLWNIRLPRVLLAAVVGGGLAMSGAALQGVFRNPLADSGLIGVSSGAASGAVLLIVAGTAPLGQYSLPVAAFSGAMCLSFVVYAMARTASRTDVATLILTGIALNALASALIGYLSFRATDAQLRSIVFWSLGSLGGATWDTVVPVVALTCGGMVLLATLGRPLNLLTLGEREAYYLGLPTERVRLAVLGLSALVAGSAVSIVGIVGFVGLVVPHVLRLIAGPDHRILLPASALAGASLLLLADLIARTVVVPRELPLGVVTALLGGPYFLWLVRHHARTLR